MFPEIIQIRKLGAHPKDRREHSLSRIGGAEGYRIRLEYSYYNLWNQQDGDIRAEDPLGI